MSLFQLFIISIVQGISEWLPISSSAHVLLTAYVFGVGGEDGDGLQRGVVSVCLADQAGGDTAGEAEAGGVEDGAGGT